MRPQGGPAWTRMVGGGSGHSVLCQRWPNCGEKPYMGSGDVDDTCTDVLVGDTIKKPGEDQVHDIPS